MEEIEQVETIASSDYRMNSIDRRRSNISSRTKTPFIPVEGHDRVINEVSGYIENQKALGEKIWANYLFVELENFRRLKYSFRLSWLLNATEYYLNRGDSVQSSDIEANGLPIASSAARALPTEIQTYDDFFKYLNRRQNSNLCAQILSFVHGAEIADRLKQRDKWCSEDRAAIAMCYPVRGRTSHVPSEALFRTTSAMICALLGRYWNIDSIHLQQLFHLDFKAVKRNGAKRKNPQRMQTVSRLNFEGQHIRSEQISILEEPVMFENDYEIYTTRPQCRPPQSSEINVLCSSDEESGRYRMITSCSFPGEVEQKPMDVRDLCNLDYQASADLIALSPRFALGALEKKSLRAHGNVLDDLSVAMQDFKYQSRSHPSPAKLDWLLYISDCIKVIVEATENLGQGSPEWPCAWEEHWDDWSRTFEEDKNRLMKTAEELVKEVEQIRRTVKEILEVKAGSRNTLLAVLAAIFIPLSFTTGIFGMNISEINDTSPRYWHVLLFGIPLALLTALLPIYFDAVWRFSYQTVPHLQKAARSPSSDSVIISMNFVLALVTILLCGTSMFFKWGPIVGFVIWASFACTVAWLRESRMVWAHWFVAMLMLIVLVFLAVSDAPVWSLVPIFAYWLLRDWLSLREFFASFGPQAG